MTRSKSKSNAAAAAAVTRGAKRTKGSKRTKVDVGTKGTNGTKAGADKTSLRVNVATLNGAVDRLTLWVRALALVVALACAAAAVGVVVVARHPPMRGPTPAPGPAGATVLPHEPVAAFETGCTWDAPPAQEDRTPGGIFPVVAAHVSSERVAPSSSRRRLQLFHDASAGSPAPGGTATVLPSEGVPGEAAAGEEAGEDGTVAAAEVAAGVWYSPDLLGVRCEAVLDSSLLADHQVLLLRVTVEVCCNHWMGIHKDDCLARSSRLPTAWPTTTKEPTGGPAGTGELTNFGVGEAGTAGHTMYPSTSTSAPASHATSSSRDGTMPMSMSTRIEEPTPRPARAEEPTSLPIVPDLAVLEVRRTGEPSAPTIPAHGRDLGGSGRARVERRGRGHGARHHVSPRIHGAHRQALGHPDTSVPRVYSTTDAPADLCFADNTQCGCADVRQSDYHGTLGHTADGFPCARWSEEFFGWYPNAGLQDNFCRNPDQHERAWCLTNDNWSSRYCHVPVCDPCSCMPACGQPKNATCACHGILQAEKCCAKEDASCKCEHLREACRSSLESGGTEFFCNEAEVACCQDGSPNCKCNMYEHICSESPSQPTCERAARFCCNFAIWNRVCRCDFDTYSFNSLEYGDGDESTTCVSTRKEEIFYSSLDGELASIKNFYESTGGDNWLNKDGWLNTTIPTCQWFGLTCNAVGLLTGIKLRKNNLMGDIGSLNLPFTKLTLLDLAKNDLRGTAMSGIVFLPCRELRHIDISNNYFHGHANMLFPPATSYVDYSHNMFSSAGFSRFSAAYETLRVVDLSHNLIDQDTSALFRNIPPNLEELFISDNKLRGPLPNPFPSQNLLRLRMAHNALNGHLPDGLALGLVEIDLSNQREKGGGLTGSIRNGIFKKLAYLSGLNLAGNELTRGIPPELGNLDQLKTLNLSSNSLKHTIPSELGRLQDLLETLDLSSNQLTGRIPWELGRLQNALETLDLSNNQLTGRIPLELTDLKSMASVHLSGNQNILNPAPLDLCVFSKFELKDDPEMCPFERTALKELYHSLKGEEWTNNSMWLDPYEGHCSWSFVICNERKTTIQLLLNNNGLSGTLSRSISVLESLENLDLSDNDIKGAIIAEIGLLPKLTHLRLSHNVFFGMEMNFEGLDRLEQVQLNGNRLQGTLPKLHLMASNPSSFVSDCGNPSEFAKSLVCKTCTMCCNSMGNCHNTEMRNPFQNLMLEATVLLLFGCLFGFACVLVLASYSYERYKNPQLPTLSNRRPAVVDRDAKYALHMIGNDSVYQFFLAKSWSGWIIGVLAIAAQIFLLWTFSQGAYIDWTSDSNEMVYTWKCARNQPKCTNTSDWTTSGCIAFGLLMAVHLLKDVISGTNMIAFAAKKRHTFEKKARFFTGGLLMTAVALYALYVSYIYNSATATSNTEIIENAVIILFVLDIDEHLYDILVIINQGWVERLMQDKERKGPIIDTDSVENYDEESRPTADSLHETTTANHALIIKVENLEKKVKDLEEFVRRSSRGASENDRMAQDSDASNARSVPRELTCEGNANPQRSCQRHTFVGDETTSPLFLD